MINRSHLILILSMVFVFSTQAKVGSKVGSKVIYGQDNRKEIYQEQREEVKTVALSTAAMMPESNLELNGNGNFNVLGSEYGSQFALCKDEPFYDQKSAAYCSGFLVGPDLIATAGHCVEDVCNSDKWVFNFAYTAPQTPINFEIQAQDVYSCAEVIKREQTQNQDYALVRLNRAVLGITPLTLAQDNRTVAGEDMLVIGHPSGLPAKIADGAAMRDWDSSNAFFRANLDTYGGNSGSAVFNARTLEVEGILVRGENDFSFDDSNSCNRSNVCEDDGCRGEDVTNIDFISKLITPPAPEPTPEPTPDPAAP